MADKEKIAALLCGLSASLTTMKNKLNHFRYFFESAHFPEAKLGAEFTQILTFLLSQYLFGESYMFGIGVQYKLGKFNKLPKVAILRSTP